MRTPSLAQEYTNHIRRYNRSLHHLVQVTRLLDAGGNNSTYWCRYCSVEFDPAEENIRRESKISVPDRDEETLVATTPGQDYLNKSVEIHHEPEIKGGLKVLKDRGIRITSYSEHIPK
jgi:hypothetical protein